LDAYLVYDNEQLFFSHPATIVAFMGNIEECTNGWEMIWPYFYKKRNTP